MSELSFNKTYKPEELTEIGLVQYAVIPGGDNYTWRTTEDNSPFLKNGTKYFPLTANDISELMDDTARVKGGLDLTGKGYEGKRIFIFRKDVNGEGPLSYLTGGTFFYALCETGDTDEGESTKSVAADLELRLVQQNRSSIILQ